MEELRFLSIVGCVMTLFGSVISCTTQTPPAHLSFDNETAQEISVEIRAKRESGDKLTTLNMAPDEDPDNDPSGEKGPNDDYGMYVWPRKRGSRDSISRDIKSIRIRTERGCIFDLTPDQFEQWSHGPDYRFWVDLTRERVNCPESAKEE